MKPLSAVLCVILGVLVVHGAALGQTATPTLTETPTETPTDTPTPTITPTPTETPGPPWPMFQHDSGHTGNSFYAGPAIPIFEWSYETGAAVDSSPVIGGSGYVCIGGEDGNMYLINSNGSLLWSYETEGAVQASSLILSDSDGSATICTGSQDNNVYAVGLNDRNPWSYVSFLWSYTTGGAIDSSAAPGSDGSIYVGSLDRSLYSLSSNGTLQWSFTTGSEIYSSPAVDSSGAIYVCSNDLNLYAVDQSCSRLWSYEIGLGTLRSSPSVDDISQNVYVGSDDYKVYTITSSGELYWSFDTGPVYSCTAVSDDGRIYATSLDNTLYAVNSVGTLAWTYVTGGQIFSSVAIDSGGKTYFGSDDAGLYILNSSGSLFWSFAAGDKIGSSPAIGSDGWMYVGSQDNMVYCIGSVPTPYVEIAVLPNIHGKYEFSRGDEVVLAWQSHLDIYGVEGQRMNVYLAAALDSPYEDTIVTVEQIISSGSLYLFDSELEPAHYIPPGVPEHTWSDVFIPDEGTIVFEVPRGAVGDWVFATTFAFGGRYVAEPPVIVSNQFTIR